ncbi:hypothetical protein BT93_L0887 [Corymbia citriodora subsp. variegata]|uniref:Glycosyltransferase n=1 Tax=Corymbia citriodora subsp. variegata TaxID=360336 RepID=A0A8T0CSV6_CORYI|nr:hypothetical protein BT93_L0887 [Corymbia citriodora subsp. variegata]
MGSDNSRQLRIFFFPFMAHGHILPTIDMAKLFASRGLKATIITTPLNAPIFAQTIQRTQKLGAKIDVKTIDFQSVEAGLPPGCENLDSVESQEMFLKFIKATEMLKQPLEDLLNEDPPDCLVADMFFPWATDVAQRLGVPRIVFHGMSFFALCAMECIRLHEPHKIVSSDSDPFAIPNFPHEIKLTRKQLPEHLCSGVENDFMRLNREAKESEIRSFGVIVNSFYELEPDYADYFRNVLGRRAWHIGAVSLCNRDIEDKARRGKKATIDEHECLKWLDSKDPNSVIYISFGSVAKFSPNQLREIALALEASGMQFIWVIRKADGDSQDKDEASGDEEWLPRGFKERMKLENKGLIIQDWAPQVLILDHKAIGAFMTHCGWNSTLEGICAGVPMVTWPVFAEQFYNEKLVTQVLRVGVEVGAQQWVGIVADREIVSKDSIERTLRQVMVGGEAEAMRDRAKLLADKARRAIEDGGSSCSDMNALIRELASHGIACDAKK